MKSSSVIVKLSTGLHARPAMKSADAKSILSVLSIGIMQDNEILIKADGEDEEMAVATLCEFVMRNE